MTENRATWLWAAVIQQAINDATLPLPASRGAERLARQRAREWLTKPNRDFDEVCTLAGLEPSRVRNHAIPLIEAAAKLDKPLPQPAPRRPRKLRTSIPERQADRIAP